jgi:hypothetical protein
MENEQNTYENEYQEDDFDYHYNKTINVSIKNGKFK